MFPLPTGSRRCRAGNLPPTLSTRRFSMNVFEQKNAELVTEFDRYVRAHPDFAERIPDNALVAMLVEGDEAFNQWSQEGAKRQAEKEQPIVYVKIKRIQPIRSRIQEIELSVGIARGSAG